MITPQYAVTMAKYNTWQNSQLLDVVEVMPEAMLTEDRGAFFGSILCTLSHLLWCDQLWLSRFDAAQLAPEGEDVTFCSDGASWREARVACDGAIRDWADTLTQTRVEADLCWFSGILQRDVEKPMAECILHFFNHQTHHRGQVHAMLTAAGHEPPVTDLIFMPETL